LLVTDDVVALNDRLCCQPGTFTDGKVIKPDGLLVKVNDAPPAARARSR